MKRILVIQDDALWLELNRHLAGKAGIRLDETPTLTLGLSLAQVESPDLIVCRAGDGGQSPQDLAHRFRSRQIDTRRVLCVQNSMPPATAEALTETGITWCRPDQFLETVDRMVAATAQSARPRSLALLAHYQLVSAQPGEPKRGFVNLLEMNPSKLLIEGSDPLQEGDIMSMNFLLPRAASSNEAPERVAVSLSCEITTCEDQDKLHYWAKIVKVTEASRAPLEHFIRTLSTREGSL